MKNNYADHKINVTRRLKFVLGRVENIVGKAEKAAFSLFPEMFSKGFLCKIVKKCEGLQLLGEFEISKFLNFFPRHYMYFIFLCGI